MTWMRSACSLITFTACTALSSSVTRRARRSARATMTASGVATWCAIPVAMAPRVASLSARTSFSSFSRSFSVKASSCSRSISLRWMRSASEPKTITVADAKRKPSAVLRSPRSWRSLSCRALATTTRCHGAPAVPVALASSDTPATAVRGVSPTCSASS